MKAEGKNFSHAPIAPHHGEENTKYRTDAGETALTASRPAHKSVALEKIRILSGRRVLLGRAQGECEGVHTAGLRWAELPSQGRMHRPGPRDARLALEQRGDQHDAVMRLPGRRRAGMARMVRAVIVDQQKRG